MAVNNQRLFWIGFITGFIAFMAGAAWGTIVERRIYKSGGIE